MNRLHIKLGQLEVEYEGPSEITKDDLFALFDKLNSLPIGVTAPLEGNAAPKEDQSVTEQTKIDINMGMPTICSKLGGKTLTERIFAACASLQIVLNTPAYSAQLIKDEIKKANGYCKAESDTKNFSKTLKDLVKRGNILQGQGNNYYLSAEKLGELQGRLK